MTVAASSAKRFAPRWRLSEIRAAADGTLSACARIESDSSWFDGHFPGQPILPGIAQLALVQELLRALIDPALALVELKKVRFRQAVGPGAALRLTAMPQAQADRYAFKIEQDSELAASGLLRIGRNPAGPAAATPPCQTQDQLEG